MKWLRLLLFTFCFLFFIPSHIFAQEEWTIDSFHSDITVQGDGQVKVVEDIAVVFNSLKHGIFRDIPYQYVFEDGHNGYVEIVLLGVLQDGIAVRHKESMQNGYLDIKIGDPNKTINGPHSYTITYLVKGALQRFENNDELFWDATGDAWEVPIATASVSVHLPSDDLLDSICFQGVYGSTTQCQTNPKDTRTVDFFSTAPLYPGEGLSIVMGFTKGMVPLLTGSPPPTFIDRLTTRQNLLGFFLPFLLILVLTPLLWWRKGRDPQLPTHNTVVAEFTPPDKLTPAQLGVLMDERADTLDVTATIVDLATRGYLTIKEEPKKWLFGNTNYILTKKGKTTEGLFSYEQELLKRLFETGNSVSVADLKRKFYDDLKEVKKLLYEDVVDKGLFAQDPEKIRNKYLIGSIIILIASVFLFVQGTSHELFLLAAISAGIFLATVLLLFFSRSMSRRTAKGAELYRRARGYELFVSKAETYRQQFFEKKNMFNEVLPYAIVFGLTQKFAQAMKDMGVTPQVSGWYYSSRPFNAVAFENNISGFSSSFSSAIAAAPKSSGFSSSGGFSGGGFGGGGGGSW